MNGQTGKAGKLYKKLGIYKKRSTYDHGGRGPGAVSAKTGLGKAGKGGA